MNGAKPTIVIAGFFLVLLHVGIVLSEARLPSTDVFLFKDAGANLALTGRFVVANLPHMSPDESVPYAYYPPVFPFVFGLWSKAFGVGLKSSMALDCFFRTLRTLLLAAFAFSQLKRRKLKDSSVVLAAGFVILLSLLSSDGDRPDELGLIFGFTSWLLIARSVPGAGIFLGLCGATSPAAGFFFALGWYFAYPKKIPLIVGGAFAALTFGLCNLPVYLADPRAFSRFSKQLPLSTFPYHSAAELCRTWLDNWSVALRFVLTTLGLSATAFFFTDRKSPIFKVAIIFIPFTALVWALQPYYLWFSSVALSAVLFGELIQETTRARNRTALFFFLSLSPLLVQELKTFANAWERPAGQSRVEALNRVLAFVKPSERLAVTPDQYFTFKGQREISNVIYVCSRLDKYDFVYVTRLISAQRTAEPTIPCPQKAQCFTPIIDTSSRKVFTLFGWDTPYFVRGNGGILFQNTGCRSVASLAKHSTFGQF